MISESFSIQLIAWGSVLVMHAVILGIILYLDRRSKTSPGHPGPTNVISLAEYRKLQEEVDKRTGFRHSA